MAGTLGRLTGTARKFDRTQGRVGSQRAECRHADYMFTKNKRFVYSEQGLGGCTRNGRVRRVAVSVLLLFLPRSANG